MSSLSFQLADLLSLFIRSEKFKAIVKELFIRCRKLMKIGNKKEIKSIAEENSGHLDFKDFLKIYNYCTKEPYSFMMVDTRPTARVTFKKHFDEPIKNL